MIDTGRYSHSGMGPPAMMGSQPQQQRQQRYHSSSSCNDDELSCKICLTVYSQQSAAQRPRRLHCQHTFCESCLQHLLRGQRERQRKDAESRFRSFQRTQADPAWSPDTVKCPLCKYRTFLGPTSIQGLPVNSAAIKHSSQTSGLRNMLYGRELHDLQPRSAADKNLCSGKGHAKITSKIKRDPKIHSMSCGTTGNRVMAQRFENFHPPPQDEVDLWELSRSRAGAGRLLRFADDVDHQLMHGGSDHGTYDADFSAGGPSFDHHGLRAGFDHHEPIVEDQGDDVFDGDLGASGQLVGQFGQYEETPSGRQGTFRSPTSIDCARDGRLAVVDADTGSVQMFARNGDYLIAFRVVGARSACFIDDAARDESLAVATSSGVSICDQTGRVDKHLPVGGDVVAVARLRHGTSGGVFVAAHRNRLTVCDRYKPTAVLRSISCMRPMNAPIGHPGERFGDIVALATTATPRVYVVDTAAVLAVDIDTGTLLQSLCADTPRLLRQPSAVCVDLFTSSVFVCDAAAHRVWQFDDGGRRRCVVQLADDGGRGVAMTTGPRGPDGHQMIYVVYRAHCRAEVRMFQI